MGEPKHIRDVVPRPVDAMFQACDESKGVDACPWCGSQKRGVVYSGHVHLDGEPVYRQCRLLACHPWHVEEEPE